MDVGDITGLGSISVGTSELLLLSSTIGRVEMEMPAKGVELGSVLVDNVELGLVSSGHAERRVSAAGSAELGSFSFESVELGSFSVENSELGSFAVGGAGVGVVDGCSCSLTITASPTKGSLSCETCLSLCVREVWRACTIRSNMILFTLTMVSWRLLTD